MYVAPVNESNSATDESVQRRVDLMIYGELRPRRFSTASMGGGDDVAGRQPKPVEQATDLGPIPRPYCEEAGGWYNADLND